MNIKVGNTVCVRDGFIDEETNVDMSGWQGRVQEIYADEGAALIEFDSITVRNMPASYIENCEEHGYSWTEYGYSFEDLEVVTPRDRPGDVAEAVADQSSQFLYAHLGEEGRAIDKILHGVEPGNKLEMFDAWEDHLSRHLSFPFTAKVRELLTRGPLNVGDQVNVHSIELVDDLYGLIAKVRRNRQVYHHPLCDLDAADESSGNYELLHLYAVWYANR